MLSPISLSSLCFLVFLFSFHSIPIFIFPFVRLLISSLKHWTSATVRVVGKTPIIIITIIIILTAVVITVVLILVLVLGPNGTAVRVVAVAVLEIISLIKRNKNCKKWKKSYSSHILGIKYFISFFIKKSFWLLTSWFWERTNSTDTVHTYLV